MTGRFLTIATLALALLASPATADSTSTDDDAVSGGGSAALPPYLQCVPYARQVSGIQLHGDAHTWWDQAAGKYARGFTPRVGAVMALKPHGNSHLGHVAAVSRIVDARTVLIRHANWSPIHGRRGQIEDNVRAVDVSPANDWSEVRVWYAPIHALGGTRWPVQGFIYKRRPAAHEQLARGERPAAPRPVPLAGPAPRQVAVANHDPIGALIARRLGI